MHTNNPASTSASTPAQFPGTVSGSSTFSKDFIPPPIDCWVAGVKFRDGWKDTLKEITAIPIEDRRVILIGEPGNPYDHYAVKVLINQRFVGYLPRTDNIIVWAANAAGWKPITELVELRESNPSRLVYKLKVTFQKKPTQ